MANKVDTSAETVIADVLSSLEAGKLAVFAGAGVSHHSGLPLATDFEKAILEALHTESADISRIISSDFPFEAFMGVIQGNCTIKHLLRVFCLGQPNKNHVLLAKLVAKGYLNTICTTNFDTLIESSLKNEDLHHGDDYRVFHRDIDLTELCSDHKGCSIIKLHGSIETENEAAITLESVAGQIYSAPRFNAIRHVFSDGNHEHVLIIGYSCSDAFDITPQIESVAADAKKVTIVQHCSSPNTIEGSSVRTEHVSVLSRNNPFRRFSDGTRLYLNTDALIDAIWSRCLPEEHYQKNMQIDSHEWKRRVDTWASSELCEHSQSVCYLIVGTVLFRLSLFERALKYFRRALDIAQNEHMQPMQAVLFNRIGNSHRCMGQVQDAVLCYEKALAIANSTNSIYGKAIEYHDLGVAYKDLGSYARAIDLLKKALDIVQQTNDTRETVGIMGDLGNAYNRMGKYNTAIQHLKQAIQMARLHGYKQAEGNALSGLGNIYTNMQEFQKAKRCHTDAIRISTEIGDQQGMGISTSNLGTAYAYLGELERAIMLHMKSLDIARVTNGRRQEAESLGNIGHVYILNKEYERAIEYLNKALHMFEELGDQQAMANALANLAGAHWGLGQNEKGIALAQKALIEFRILVGNEHPRVKHLEMALRNAGDNLD